MPARFMEPTGRMAGRRIGVHIRDGAIIRLGSIGAPLQALKRTRPDRCLDAGRWPPAPVPRF